MHASVPMNELHLFVTAHPDDETMFFLPTIRYLKEEKGATVWLLCLTTGDYDGLGKIRSKELRECVDLLELDRLLQGEDLQDHPRDSWDLDVASQYINKVLWEASKCKSRIGDNQFDRIQLYTFDKYGVSGHLNHRDTYYAVARLHGMDQRENTLPVHIQTLRTEHNVFLKYIPVIGWLHVLLYMLGVGSKYQCSGQDAQRIYRMAHPTLNWEAMATHRSQFVWYRRLFVIFSCYTYMNVWDVLPV